MNRGGSAFWAGSTVFLESDEHRVSTPLYSTLPSSSKQAPFLARVCNPNEEMKRLFWKTRGDADTTGVFVR